MRVGLLGALEVLDADGRPIELRGAKQRALLALLSLSAGRMVSTEQIVDALWGEDPPPGVRNGLQGLVSKLRRSLGDPKLVVTQGPGYVLEIAPEAVDVHRFEQLLASAREAASAGDDAAAAIRFAEADDIWRGDALAEFAYEEFARPSITRLTELRLAVIEERMTCELGLGRHAAAIASLEPLVAEHPLREGLRAQLMLALYRHGRQADALRVFQEGRHILGEELGLDPGPELQRLEAAVLAHDPSLAAPAPRPSPGAAAVDQYSNLPAPLTPLVGREHELRELTALFADHRLLTLVGPGGVGKTRLAVDLARAESAAMANGAVIVELAAIGDPAGVRSAVAGVLEISNADRMAEVIRDRELLIVLDNCEHVIESAAAVAEDLLQLCPRLRLLATSREALRIAGERVWPVPPLAADDAAELFIARAHAAGARFDVSDDLLPLVTDICTRLDGLPLAIELAAARTRVFPLQQLAERLDDRFRLLTGGSRTALPRQQALRAVVDWSYDLLFDEQRRVFERLSVFPGGCTLASAAAVCADEHVAEEDVGEIIEALVDKSLVTAHDRGDEARFLQLQTLAQYGRDKLAERGDAARIRDRMAEHYAGLCAGSIAAFAGVRQREWLAAVADEHDNLRAALEWAIETDNAEVALCIAGGTGWPHWLTGKVVEGKRWVDDAFRCHGEVTRATRALALFSRGFISFLAGASEHTDADLEEAADIYREQDDVRALTVVLGFAYEVAFAGDDIAKARSLQEAAVTLHDGRPDDPFNAASRVYSEGVLALADGDIETAEARYRDAAAQYADGENGVMQAICTGMLARFDASRGDLSQALDEVEQTIKLNEDMGLVGYMGIQLARLGIMRMAVADFEAAEVANARSLELGRRLMDAPVLGMALSSTARLALRLGRLDDAAVSASEALEIYQLRANGGPSGRRNLAFDVPAGAAAAFAVLGFVAELQGDGAEAERLHRQGLDQARQTREARAMAVAAEGLAGAATALGDGRRAAELLGSAAQTRVVSSVPAGDDERHQLERIHDATTALLGHDAFGVAFEQGRHLDLDEVVGVSPALQ